MLELQNVVAGYGRTTILHDVSLTGPSTGVVAVLGHNGAGKSTVLRVVVGLLKPASGAVTWNGEDISRLAPNKRVRLGMAYVPQGQQSFGQLTTLENLQVVADRKRNGRALIDGAFERFPALVPLRSRRAGLLSGGQRQQLAIARALLTEPRLLILDEPTEGIQPSVVTEIENAIIDLSEAGLQVLLVEQHIGFALQAAERYYVLASGRVSSTGAGGIGSQSEVRESMKI